MSKLAKTILEKAGIPRLERIPAAAKRIGISTSGVYREIKSGRLGPLVKISLRASALPAESVDNFIRARIEEAQKGGAL